MINRRIKYKKVENEENVRRLIKWIRRRERKRI